MDLQLECDKKLELAQDLLNSLDRLEKVNGVVKLKTKIKQDIAFLKKANSTNSLSKENIVGTNLNHFEALVKKLLSQEIALDSVYKIFHYKDDSEQENKITVDIVSSSNTKWTKVVARNPKALSRIFRGDCEYQKKSVADHARDFLLCASQNLVFFKPPTVEFHFASGVELELAQELSNLGVRISGKVIEDGNLCEFPCQFNHEREIVKLNLDVTAMIAYISAVSNGNAHKKVKGKVLTSLAEMEKINPVKPVLDQLLDGKELFTCATAFSIFNIIINTIGGNGEKKRAGDFLKRIKVVDDVPCRDLEPSGQIKERSLIIFGTGKSLKAITVTANSSFVRSAENQGVHFDVFIHEPRALTEKKELD